MNKKHGYLGYHNYQAIEHSSYALVALQRVLEKISDRLDYTDLELRMLMVDLHQESMIVANMETLYVMNMAKLIEKQIYKGYERQLLLEKI